MEKSSFALTEQLEHLKKSLKNKRNCEKWEQIIQFYRNNQSGLTSYHILKIVKAAMKPLKSTIIKNCRYLGKLIGSCNKHSDGDAKLQDQIGEQAGHLRNKIKVLLNLLDCYTLALQAVLISSDPLYFNMMHRHNYHAFHSNKQLIFESATLENETPLTNSMLQHQMLGYFHFVCSAINLYATSLLCWADEALLLRFFKALDIKMASIWDSSCQFSTRKVEYECIKLNFMANHPNQNLPMQHHIPLQILHAVQKHYRKWEVKKIKHSYDLLIRHLFFSFLNVNNPHLLYQPSKHTRNPHINAFTEIYIYMKEMLHIYQLVNYRIAPGFNKYLLEFMTALIDSYETKLHEMQIWSQFLSLYFQYHHLLALAAAGNPSACPPPFQNTSLVRVSSQQETSKSKMHNWRINKIGRQQGMRMEQKKKASLKIRLEMVIKQLGDAIFNYIEESDSDEQGQIVHQFQLQRLREISEIQCQSHWNRLGSRSPEGKQGAHFMAQSEAELKLGQLHTKNKQLWGDAAEARYQLGKKRECGSLEKKLQTIEEENSIMNSPMALVGECKYIGLRGENKIPFAKPELKWGEVKLGNLSHKKRQPAVPQKQHQTIFLSNKYDSMSRNLLLSSTTRQTKQTHFNI